MRTTFSGIEIARRALQAQQLSLDIVGHNVANANTPGYSRQVAVHKASSPYPAPQFTHNPVNGMIGTGVEISQISRMRDEFIETRLRHEKHNHNYWQALSDGLEQVELIFNEPSDSGIHYALDLFWDSLNELSKNPENEATREVVLQRGEVLAESVRHVRFQLGKLRDNMNGVIDVKVNEINSIAARIAELNKQIVKVNVSGYQPNDLMDKRDELLQELSEIVNIETVCDQFGAVTVSISGATIVQRNEVFTLGVRSSEEDVFPNYDRQEVIWQGSNVPAEITGGELFGIISFRDNEIQDFITDLNVWTANLINEVNSRHEKGYDLNSDPGKAFFTINSSEADEVSAGDDPSLTITVNLESALEIAASSQLDNGEVVAGNGDIALELASLRNQPVIEGGSTLSQSYNAIISRLGVKAMEANNMVNNEEVLVSHLENLRESISGVSLDEEMADMIKFQHAYAAAARIMTAMDQALDTIIYRLGVVGQ